MVGSQPQVHITCRVRAHPAAHVVWKRDGRRVTGTSSGVVTSTDGEVPHSASILNLTELIFII